MEANDQPHAPTALHQDKEPLEPIEQKAGWSSERVWLFRRNVGSSCRDSSPGPFSQQPGHYTDYAIAGPQLDGCE